VLVENGGFGASAAAPIARAVIDAYLGNEKNQLRSPAKAAT
jgi:cell division protein FtsI/penicillin-binding protein 2